MSSLLLSMSSQSSSLPSKMNAALVLLAITKLVATCPSGDSALLEFESWGKKWVVVPIVPATLVYYNTAIALNMQ
jgi:hypothetical protein